MLAMWPLCFSAEQVAGPADFEVAHGDFEAGAEGGVFLHGVEAFAGIAGGRSNVAGQHQVGIGLGAGAPDAAAELVEVGQAEQIGAVDEDGIGVRDIDAGFDDGGGDQHVGVAAHERVHDVLEFVAVHLAVAGEDAGIRGEPLEFLLHLFDGLHPVVQVENLAAAVNLVADGVADDAFVVRADDGLDRQAVGRRGFDGAHFPQADQRHVERARESAWRRGSSHRPVGTIP